MGRFLLSLIVNAVALWLTTLIVSGVTITAYASDTFAIIVTYLMVALIFGVVNGVLGTFIRIIAFPLYVLTLGLLALIVNAALLMLVSGISDLIGFGLHVDDFFWSGVFGAIVLAIVSWLLGLFIRPLTRRKV
ncbi:phage holin family protein [Homoserinimonas sp. OAct 916]|uniref:phage holin family protein n=1 Tax=Homoserinimonas sp. OAct 916 TaxID=2211450 RepID=UPI000DBE56CA|nr:phage holin family protein [Homoserinimonas sp. OAct 916]